MYNIGPVVTAAWDGLYRWLSTDTGVELPIVYNAFPEPIEALWTRPNMGCVLMCGYPFIRATSRPTLLAAPVPAPAHYEGQSVYRTHLLVLADSPYESIEDTFGGRISWTIENSQSGYNAVRNFLLGYRTTKRPTLYRESIGPIGTFTVGVAGMRRGEIDVVPIDSFSYDLMQRYTPEQLAGTRIIASTAAAPFPPLVGAHDLPPTLAARLRAGLLRAHEEPDLQSILKTMMIRRFDAVSDSYYEPMLAQERAALAAGYPKPA